MKNLKNVIVNDNLNNIEIVGGKGWNLKILNKSNIRVPKFFIISSSKLFFIYAKRLS